MKKYITPMVLAVTTGMCYPTRPVRRVVLTSEVPITPAMTDELRLPVGNDDTEEIAEDLQALLESWRFPVRVESDTHARALRFHELVDRDFLGILTPAESKELEVLTKWRDDQKSTFYQNIALE